MHKNNNLGFTLIELIVVIAIMAILTSIIAINATSYIEKTRESTDLSNVGSAVRELQYAIANHNHQPSDDIQESEPLHKGNTYENSVLLSQKHDNWTLNENKLNISGVSFGSLEWHGSPKANGTCNVYYKNNKIHIDWSGNSAGNDESQQQDTTDYSLTDNVAKYALSYLQKDLLTYKSNPENSSFNDVYLSKFDNNPPPSQISLPNGESINVKVYSRNYSQFDDVKTRCTEARTASMIYNRSTGEITTIIYYDGKDYVAWSLGPDNTWTSNSYKK